MMFPTALRLLLLSALTSATRLYVSSYAGNVTTLDYTPKGANGSTLAITSSLAACNPDPSWLELDTTSRTLYCIGEQAANASLPGSLTAFTISATGVLQPASVQDTVNGGVNSILYGSPGGTGNNSFLAIAHYGGSALSTFAVRGVTNATSLHPAPLQSFTFALSAPGARPDRQLSPHPHQALLDPTGGFILVPDLGADLVRVFRVARKTGLLSACPAILAPPGSGPRHARFHVSKDKDENENEQCGGNQPQTTLYLASELADTVTAYNVLYPSGSAKGCLAFEKIERVNSLQPGTQPNGTAVAEVVVTGDFLIVSNRNDSTSSSTAPSNVPITNGDSDTLVTFAIAPNGAFKYLDRSPSYGSFPRQFSVNKEGDLVAVGNQHNGTVAIIRRDVSTGYWAGKVAEVEGLGNVTSVVWDE